MVALSVAGVYVELEDSDALTLCDALWGMALEKRGAITAAAEIRRMIAYQGRRTIRLDGKEADAVRAAFSNTGLGDRFANLS